MSSAAHHSNNSWWHLVPGNDGSILHLSGSWRISNLKSIAASLPGLRITALKGIDGSELEGIDSAGAMLLFQTLLAQGIEGDTIALRGFPQEQAQLMQLVMSSLEAPRDLSQPELSILQKLGKATIGLGGSLRELLVTLGETLEGMVSTIARPAKLRTRELFVQLELVFLDAIPIVCLVTFLIGIVVAYLFASQIQRYGANIFIVDAVALAMCRELSPIIVAIIVAGRSGSAFTAQIGTMKLNEEIDALLTLGLSPMHVLVLPRLFALIIAMPLLVFVGDIVSIIGSILVADIQLGITGATYIDRLQTVLPLRSFLVGLIKAPVFAAFIAIIGCRMGFAVENNARSVGLNTTSTVVQSIVSVILLNAGFAVLFVELGI